MVRFNVLKHFLLYKYEDKRAVFKSVSGAYWKKDANPVRPNNALSDASLALWERALVKRKALFNLYLFHNRSLNQF